MKYRLSFQEQSGYLRVRVQGKFVPHGAREELEAIRKKAMQGEFVNILVDAMEVSAPSSEFERFLMGEALAEIFPRPFKVAILYKKELINKFAENTAVNRGADLLVCGTEAEAFEWLLGSRRKVA